MLRRASFASAIVLVVVARSSVPELTFVEDGTIPEGGVDTGGKDTSTPPPIDSGTDTSPICVKTGNVEICDDDIDNDCNGFKDCADPACGGGFGCEAPAPMGWTLLAFVESAPPACPTGYTTPTDLRVITNSGVHTCPCSCTGSGGSGPTCAGAPTTVTTGDDPACLAGQTTASLNSNTGVVCAPVPAGSSPLQVGSTPMGGSTGFAMITSPAGPATCTPNGSITKTDPTDGRACTPPSKTGTGCTAPARCLPKAPGYSICIAMDGDQTCPTGYTKKRRTGTTSNDTRSCDLCTCNNTPCTGTIDLWSNNVCNQKVSHLTTAGNSTCAAPQAVSGKDVTATHFKSTITGGCVGTPSQVQGQLTFGGERTICCK